MARSQQELPGSACEKGTGLMHSGKKHIPPEFIQSLGFPVRSEASLLSQDWIIFFCVSKTYLLKRRVMVTGWAESFLLLSSSLFASPFPALDFFLEAAVRSVLVSGFSPSVKTKNMHDKTAQHHISVCLEKMNKQLYFCDLPKEVKYIRKVTFLYHFWTTVNYVKSKTSLQK